MSETSFTVDFAKTCDFNWKSIVNRLFNVFFQTHSSPNFNVRKRSPHEVQLRSNLFLFFNYFSSYRLHTSIYRTP